MTGKPKQRAGDHVGVISHSCLYFSFLYPRPLLQPAIADRGGRGSGDCARGGGASAVLHWEQYIFEGEAS